ncbi:hypothetical protein GGX14DRAFT_407893 [Mycena pura]|uniref:Uncharacterized protein n=1 Tax=Mycena pura TaxID=153505 RepID=A0AAD6UNX6_9AGAR|nr:hypothetical protein GGX14DRAFT_407893 [Mycena pura]
MGPFLFLPPPSLSPSLALLCTVSSAHLNHAGLHRFDHQLPNGGVHHRGLQPTLSTGTWYHNGGSDELLALKTILAPGVSLCCQMRFWRHGTFGVLDSNNEKCNEGYSRYPVPQRTAWPPPPHVLLP